MDVDQVTSLIALGSMAAGALLGFIFGILQALSTTMELRRKNMRLEADLSRVTNALVDKVEKQEKEPGKAEEPPVIPAKKRTELVSDE